MYINDRTTGAHGSQWLQHPELYDLSRDPAESYDLAKLHPELIEELMRSLETQMQTFPPNVVAAYTKLKQDKGDVSTPPGASPRPAGVPVWGWTPPDRRS
jgi:arylsulfatase